MAPLGLTRVAANAIYYTALVSRCVPWDVVVAESIHAFGSVLLFAVVRFTMGVKAVVRTGELTLDVTVKVCALAGGAAAVICVPFVDCMTTW